jgi:hypothetical protein
MDNREGIKPSITSGGFGKLETKNILHSLQERVGIAKAQFKDSPKTGTTDTHQADLARQWGKEHAATAANAAASVSKAAEKGVDALLKAAKDATKTT